MAQMLTVDVSARELPSKCGSWEGVNNSVAASEINEFDSYGLARHPLAFVSPLFCDRSPPVRKDHNIVGVLERNYSFSGELESRFCLWNSRPRL